MTTKAGDETVVEGEEKAAEGETKTAGEIAAEARAAAAEQRAAEKEAELERVKSEGNKRQAPDASKPQVYGLGSFSEAEWAEAEQNYGMDRKALLLNMNQRAQVNAEVHRATSVLEARAATKEALEEALEADPLSPKYKGESKKFLADIPTDMMLTEEGRKKWIAKAVEYGKRSIKAPSSTRKADDMSTRETSTPKEKGHADDNELSIEEKGVLESHGRTPEDYAKIKHPFIKDGIMIKERPEAPKFGNK